MKRKIRDALCLLLAGVLLSSLLAPAALAAGPDDGIHLRTAEDLADLSRNCTLDSWSVGKTVYLDADIDLSGTAFSPIPTFGGTFQGQGHTVSGLSITGSGDVRGLFRYIQPSGSVHDLSVEGTVAPSGRQNTLGLLAGDNRGTVSNCTAAGTVSGKDRIAGLVGVNETEGQIINCSFSGSVSGAHYAGGIAGQNYGTIIQCQNSGSINTTEVDASVDLEDLDREQLNAAENVPVCTDIGGITGFSAGILQGCVNTGPVGYAHVGYNIGGIAGRQSGYLDSCTNSGAILGRKDVGGITGQLEPEVRLLYRQGDLNTLLQELDVLQELIGQTGTDLRSSSADFSQRMRSLSARVEETQDAVGSLSDAAADWTNDTVGQINSLSARVSWLIGQLSPILEETARTLEAAEDLADQLDAALDSAAAAQEPGASVVRELKAAAQALRQSAASGKAAADHLRQALRQLGDALGNAGQSETAMAAVRTAAGETAASFTRTAEDLRSIAALLEQGGSPDAQTDAVRALADTLEQAGTAVARMRSALEAGLGSGDWSAAGEAAEAALDDLQQAAQALQTASGHAAEAAALLPGLTGQLSGLAEALRSLGTSLEQLLSQSAANGKDLAEVLLAFSRMPAVTLRPIDSDMQAQGDAVGDALSGLLQEGAALQESMALSADTLLDDLDRIQQQFAVITDVLRDLLDTSEQPAADRFEDVSDQEAGTSGTVSHARNTGDVAGDVDVAGIAGSMAIEYDFDPEDDLVREGDRSLDFRYQTRAVASACVNTGAVTGKQDYAGGIVGRMDLGRVSGCENYGAVTSTDGDYVGGVAGASWGSIRDSWNKSHLSGGDYIGGIAGLGATLTGCRALTAIDQGEAFLGAIAGDVASGGTVSGNLFTHDTLGGLDGVSYAGRAEPVDFAALCSAEDTPAAFSQLELTFVADGAVIAVVPFQYGQGLDTLPQIPAKRGYSAAWPDLDYTHLTASQTLEAIYTPYTSALTDGGALPDILVDGSFSSQASVSHTTQTVSWTDKNGVSHTGEACTVTVSDPALEQTAYTVHYRLADPGARCLLWVQEDGCWVQSSYEIDGQYLLLHSQTDTVTFCVTEEGHSIAVWILAAGALLLAGCAAALAVKKKRRRPSPEPEAESEQAELPSKPG